MTIVLKGGYYEHTPVFDKDGKKFAEFTRWCGPGTIIKRKAHEFHWLELEGEQPATTLFFMGPQQREWGFLVEVKKGIHRWVNNNHYLSQWTDYHNKYIANKRIK
jgi:hypothetical protein